MCGLYHLISLHLCFSDPWFSCDKVRFFSYLEGSRSGPRKCAHLELILGLLTTNKCKDRVDTLKIFTHLFILYSCTDTAYFAKAKSITYSKLYMN